MVEYSLNRVMNYSEKTIRKRIPSFLFDIKNANIVFKYYLNISDFLKLFCENNVISVFFLIQNRSSHYK